ncbi:response regulator transcription factor [Photobacterium japonica]|uniref:winged helix-turn-helix domain-containing protein n=1 Tax=Photobacterium japonica TaxID=2910235 RepID=UPI003D0E4266
MKFEQSNTAISTTIASKPVSEKVIVVTASPPYPSDHEYIAQALSVQGYDALCIEETAAIQSIRQRKGRCVFIPASMNPPLRQSLLSVTRQTALPTIIFTREYCQATCMASFLEGADDYICLPQQLETLPYRVNAILRRPHYHPNPAHTLIVDQLRLDKTVMRAQYSEHDLKLTPIEFKLLWQLAQHRQCIVSKSDLCDSVLERTYRSYDRSIDMHLSRVRKKLHCAGMAADRIKTLHGRGYRFT